MPRKKKNAENHRLSTLSLHKEKPVQRNAANARERARMRVLSRAFCRLKTTLPWVPADTKLSKLDTLRLAASYIAHLKGILRDEPFTSDDSIHPAMNLTWPFGFNRGGGNGSGGGGSGSEDAESGSSCAWEEASGKDCVHLEDPDDDAPMHFHVNSTMQLHIQTNSNDILPHYVHQDQQHIHHHHQHHHHNPTQILSAAQNSMISTCYHDDIMSIG